MSRFTGPLTVTNEGLGDADLWCIHQPFPYEVGHKGSGRVIEAPKGFLTNGTSVPRILWMIEPPWGRAVRASIIHDWLYELLCRGTPHPEAPTRARADAIFHEALLVCGVAPWAARLIWAAVRVFGRASVRPLN